jgi:integrase
LTHNIETKTSRQRLVIARQPYFVRLGNGTSIGYRRNVGPGAWLVKIADGHGSRRLKNIAIADDDAQADGKSIMSYLQACDAARRLGRGESPEKQATATTLADVLDAYETDLQRRGRDVMNVTRIRKHATTTFLARPVALMDRAEFRSWRDGLARRMKSAAVDRTCRGMKAALNLAAETDTTLDRSAWTVGLSLIKEKSPERHHVPLSEPVIADIVAAARAQSVEFGNVVQSLAETGCRYSQLARVLVADLLPDDMLAIPVSMKGRGTKAIGSYQLPISAGLAARLRIAAADRPVTAPLFLRADGKGWRHTDERERFKDAAAAAGQPGITSYSLRHSWIINALLKNVPARLVAANADTSLSMLEKTYSRYIRTGSDSLMRAALPNVERQEADLIQLR